MIGSLLLILALQSRPEPDWLPVLDAPRNLSHELTLPTPERAGPKLEIKGTVFERDGKTPAAGIVVYFHHTDARGLYPAPRGATDWTRWHGTVRGWLKTDAKGRYVLRTTKPAPYPGETEPAHIHAYGVVAGRRDGFMFPDILFDGDPLIDAAYWARLRRFGTTPYPGIRLTRSSDGVLRGRWNFVMPISRR